MSQMSRRQFFRALSGSPAKYKLGSFQNFPVGMAQNLTIGSSSSIFIESLPEGIRVKDINEGHYLRLSIGDDGQIYLHLKETWPKDVVLSSITATAYHIS
ncbi:MAG: hypothetical protein H3C47_01325 [Candidatus Cloacimonetes bacterium]|nr:hypothetical protein [Candidatus Cloacimonadota bacterium]